ncbi:17-beta dehydrogenase 4 variant [Fimicolochytrium jonesii]|uniref:17-beta dehydrogenase 4 variant n=1 Tax=Fimicolochytrium jonesii TaxID=1396493 RepID=UPI0022FE39BF|nr:17-beta dehydrogenase 4 variant [Fimicolochytrium jonesii]KAI8826865.1 17-beta dehydrogenase 4 variant [Fimicolochytrium jonesii]
MAEIYGPSEYEYTERDLALYALGVGATREDLRWVYENDENFAPLPTFGVVPPFNTMMETPFGDFLPGFNPMMLLHGEQYLELHHPAPTSGKLITTGKIVDIVDKGKGVVVVMGTTTKDEEGNVIYYNEFSNFIRGVKNVGNKSGKDRGPATASNDPPNRKPDAIVQEKTTENQAALYRLSGDTNPLHIDPNMSSIGGFDVPILHGLCSFGISAKHVLKHFGESDGSKVKSIKARFSKHVFPGETLQTEMWKEGNKVIYQVRVLERDAIAISNAALVFHGDANDASASAGGAAEASAPAGVSAPGFKASPVFEALKAAIESGSEEERKARVGKTKALFQFNLTTSPSSEPTSWTVDLKNGLGSVNLGPAKNPDATVIVSDDDFVALAAGKANAQKLFMGGKLKVKGQMMLAMKLDSVLQEARKKAKL